MKTLMLYPDVQPVKGFERSMLYDLGRNKTYAVPNSLLSFLENEVKESSCLDEVEEEYSNFLLENELAFYADNFDRTHLQSINFQWKSPYLIQVIEAEITNHDVLEKIAVLQKKWDIPFIQLVIRSFTTSEKIDDFVKSLRGSTLIQLNLIFLCPLNNFDFLTHEDYQQTFVQQLLIDRCNIHLTEKDQSKKIHFITEQEYQERFSKIEDRFLCNIHLFSETQHHHPYFNKRLYIHASGEMTNGKESIKSIGSIYHLENTDELKELISSPEFTSLWNVKKMNCDVCKDCEFRNMCLDNRIPIQRSTNEWFHEKECIYNPYICKWSDEEGYKTLKECGITSNQEGFFIEHTQLRKIVSELWEESICE